LNFSSKVEDIRHTSRHTHHITTFLIRHGDVLLDTKVGHLPTTVDYYFILFVIGCQHHISYSWYCEQFTHHISRAIDQLTTADTATHHDLLDPTTTMGTHVMVDEPALVFVDTVRGCLFSVIVANVPLL
jgi:hypothetical protein